MNLELLDPRRDAEPGYWQALRARAGLRADWDWAVLTALAWGARARLLIAVLHDDSGPRGVVCAGWSGLPWHRHSFAPVRGGPVVGWPHVRSPGNRTLPGWWIDSGDVRELVSSYAKGIRRELGAGCVGLLLRQVSEADLARLGRRPRLVRPTEPVWAMDTAQWTDRSGWLGTLKGKRRSNLRKIFRDVDGNPELEVCTDAGPDTDPARLTDLLRHNDIKYGGRLAPPIAPLTGYAAALLSRPDARCVTYTDRRTGALVGFGTVLDHPEWPVAGHWSMVPIDAGGVRFLYFHHFGGLIDWAISTGKRGILLGKGKAWVKGSLGAYPIPQHAVALPAW